MSCIADELRDSASLLLEVAARQTSIIERMICSIWESMRGGGKLLICGNGGSAADAQHLAAECIVRLQKNRCPMPAIALTTDTSILTAAGNDLGFETVFARQVEGLGRAGDILLTISTSGNSRNLVLAAEQARRSGLKTVGLLGKDGGVLRSMLDIVLVVPSTNTQHIQEVHIAVGHVICGALERQLVAESELSGFTKQ